MPKMRAHEEWTVLPHGPLRQLTGNLWTVEGSLPDMPIKRVCSIVRLRGGKLVLHNAIALEERAMAEIEHLGDPAFLLVPNGWHRLDAKVFKDRYPAARVLCPGGALERVGEVIHVDGTYDAFPGDVDVRVQHLEGVERAEGFLEVRSEGRVSLVFNDLVFNQPHLPGLFGFVYRLIGSSGGPRVPLALRMRVVTEKKVLRSQLEELAGIPELERVVVMHGTSVEEAPGDFLRAVAATL